MLLAPWPWAVHGLLPETQRTAPVFMTDISSSDSYFNPLGRPAGFMVAHL